MKVVADENYKFRSEGMKVYIEENILGMKNPNPNDIKERINAIKSEKAKIKIKERLHTEKTFWRKQK